MVALLLLLLLRLEILWIKDWDDDDDDDFKKLLLLLLSDYNKNALDKNLIQNDELIILLG